jgi:hypothetical protein
MSFAAFAAATDAEFEFAVGARNAKTLFGLSADVTKSCSAVAAAAFADAGLNFVRVSADCGAAVSVRTPKFEAAIVGAMPLDAEGVMVAGAGAAVVCAEPEALGECG